VSGEQNGAERSWLNCGLERSAAVSRSQKKVGAGRIAERERSGDRAKSAASATAPVDILLFRLHVTRITRSHGSVRVL